MSLYCPNCGSQNADGASFCRTCGVNLSLVPQALTGQLPNDRRGPRRGRNKPQRVRDEDRPPNIGHGITKLFIGLGFLIAALAIFFSPGGRGWWWAMLFPAFATLGKGISEIISARMAMTHGHDNRASVTMPPRRQTGELPPEPPSYQIPPPSVTEQTTRHLDPNKDRYPQNR